MESFNRAKLLSINIIEALKVLFYPNEGQKVLFEKHFGANRFIWNNFPEVRIEYHTKSKASGKAHGLDYFQTSKLLTELKKEKTGCIRYQSHHSS